MNEYFFWNIGLIIMWRKTSSTTQVSYVGTICPNRPVSFWWGFLSENIIALRVYRTILSFIKETDCMTPCLIFPTLSWALWYPFIWWRKRRMRLRRNAGMMLSKYQYSFRQTRDIHPRLVQCWHSVYDAGPPLNQPWWMSHIFWEDSFPCLLGFWDYITRLSSFM